VPLGWYSNKKFFASQVKIFKMLFGSRRRSLKWMPKTGFFMKFFQSQKIRQFRTKTRILHKGNQIWLETKNQIEFSPDLPKISLQSFRNPSNCNKSIPNGSKVNQIRSKVKQMGSKVNQKDYVRILEGILKDYVRIL